MGRSRLYSPCTDMLPPDRGCSAHSRLVNGGEVMLIIVTNIGMEYVGILAAASTPVSEAESGSPPPHLALASFMPIIVVLLGWLTTVVATMTKEGTVAAAVFTQFDLGVLHSKPTLTFSPTSSYTYSTPNTWDMPPPSPTIVSEFPDVVSAHPFNILPHIAPEPFILASLMQPWPYDIHRFTSFHPHRTDTDNRKLHLTACPHITHTHTLKHETFCLECICPTHYPYGNNQHAK
jgi:hypothetical protein